MKPVIGVVIALDPRVAANKYVIGAPYIHALSMSGAVPLLIPATDVENMAEEYIGLVNGLLIPGGEDVTPLLYGEDALPEVTYMNETKDRMELQLIKLAVDRGLPIFGICRGLQLINICFGGTLYQDLYAQKAGWIGHRQNMLIRSQLTHRVELTSGSLMEHLFGREPLYVNSYHHQAIKMPAEGFLVTAKAPDGVIEAIEDPAHNIYAVQWHPEELVVKYPRFLSLFNYLVSLAIR